MLDYKDSQLITDENSEFKIAAISFLGDRAEQQDCFGYMMKQAEGLVAICDGMGGHRGGALASKTGIRCLLEEYSESTDDDDKMLMLINAARKANNEIYSLTGDDGDSLKAGTTLASVIIEQKKLMWCSVGDSRAYLMRGGEFVQLTVDHNYLTVLTNALEAGTIDIDRFNSEKDRGEALISYLGIGDLKLIDHSISPFELMTDDKILIMSDGLYKTVSDEEMARVLENFSNIGDALQALLTKANRNAKINHVSKDNITIAIIKIK